MECKGRIGCEGRWGGEGMRGKNSRRESIVE